MDLDAPVRTYLPWFALQSEEDAARITLRNLATHHAGYVGDYFKDTGRDDESTLILDIVGNDLGILIGRRGETLSALQYLTRLMLNHRLHHWSNVVVDVEEYKNRRERALQQLATRTAADLSYPEKSDP